MPFRRTCRTGADEPEAALDRDAGDPAGEPRKGAPVEGDDDETDRRSGAEDGPGADGRDIRESPAGEDDPELPGDPRTTQLLFAAALFAWTAWAFLRWGMPQPGPAAVVSGGGDGPAGASGGAAGGGARPGGWQGAEAGAGRRPTGGAAQGPEADAVASEGGPSPEEKPPGEELGSAHGERDDAGPGPADAPGRVVPAPPRPDWPSRFTPPKRVVYTVRNGGTLKNVANLHKIFHHEIAALNPGVSLDKELAPGTKVVVYRRDRAKPSSSVGFPGDGRLEGGVPMPDGPGRLLKMIPWKSWGTGHTVAVIDQVLRTWHERFPEALPILVGNLSAPRGGPLPPHSTHQSGRDVDLGYPQKPGVEKEYNWRPMDARLLDAEHAWALLEILAGTGAVEVIFVDRSIQKLLYDHAVKTRRYTPGQLARWMEYPRPTGTKGPLLQHVKGHVDHMHVRIACHPDDRACKSRPR